MRGLEIQHRGQKGVRFLFGGAGSNKLEYTWSFTYFFKLQFMVTLISYFADSGL